MKNLAWLSLCACVGLWGCGGGSTSGTADGASEGGNGDTAGKDGAGGSAGDGGASDAPGGDAPADGAGDVATDGGGGDSGGTDGGGQDTAGDATKDTGGAVNACGFAACGGDPVGDWTFQKTCIEPLNPLPACPGAKAEFVVDTTGTVAIASDKAFTLSTSTSGKVTFTVPGFCLAAAGYADCAGFEGDLTMQYPGATCSGSLASSCVCTQTQDPETRDETGTWSSSGSQLTLMPQSGGATTYDHCVMGSQLMVYEQSMTSEGLLLKITHTLTK